MSSRSERIPSEPSASWMLDQTFTVIADHLPASLVSPSALRRVLAVTRQLPAILSRFAYVECRLTAGDPQVDIILNVTDDGKRLIAGQNPAIQLPRRLREHPVWQRLSEFCRHWIDPASPVHDSVRSIWLEFDLDEPPGDVPVPGVFVRFDGGNDLPTSVPEPEKAGLVRDIVFPLLLGRDLPPATYARLQPCFDALPTGAQVSEVGVLLPRSADWVRLCLKGLPEHALLPYLSAIGWPGDRSELEAVLRTFSETEVPGRGRPLQPGYLDLDVGDAVHARLGLEYFLQRGARQLLHGMSETGWLDKLVAAGLCSPDKRAGLLAWPGYFHARFAHELWPSLVVRQANHVKLVYTPGQPLVAKAYLNFLHQHYKRVIGGDPWTHSSSAPSTSQPLLS
jgi:hypothetical protein